MNHVSSQPNEMTSFAMITYTYDSNISHLASPEYHSTRAATLNSLYGYVGYLGRVASKTVDATASCQDT
jgi:hypothetical protein